MPVEPAIRTLPPLPKAVDRPVDKVDKMADPRYRRTRAQICTATRRLLESGQPNRLTFAMVAEAAEVNRSTVHQHYASRHELVADALATDLALIAEPLDRCPFERSRAVPPELVEMFTAVEDQRLVLDRLDDIECCLLADRLTELLTARLAARFADGARPPGFDRVRSEIHARFVAAGLVGLLFARPAGEPATSAKQAWQLITPVSG